MTSIVDAQQYLFTSESVTEGHPDKMCDQISDAVLDDLLKSDPASRVAVETMVTTGQVHVVGEVTTAAYVDIPGIVRETILDIGYDSSTKGFDGQSCGVSVSIGQPWGQRSGFPSCCASLSTISSEKASPSSSAWTCDSAAE